MHVLRGGGLLPPPGIALGAAVGEGCQGRKPLPSGEILHGTTPQNPTWLGIILSKQNSLNLKKEFFCRTAKGVRQEFTRMHVSEAGNRNMTTLGEPPKTRNQLPKTNSLNVEPPCAEAVYLQKSWVQKMGEGGCCLCDPAYWGSFEAARGTMVA
ncbi:UNVERIFIED_CONTAM: hypothetical protein K2H54_016598 [Gekko kuhli]